MGLSIANGHILLKISISKQSVFLDVAIEITAPRLIMKFHEWSPFLPHGQPTSQETFWQLDHFKIILLLQLSTTLKVCIISVIHGEFLTVVSFSWILKVLPSKLTLARLRHFVLTGWQWSLMVPHNFYFLIYLKKPLEIWDYITSWKMLSTSGL